MSKKVKSLDSLHKEIYKYMKKKALSYEGEVSGELKSYRNAQKKLSKRDFRVSNFKELMNSIKSSRAIYLGDFHTFDQYGRNFERILRQLFEEPHVALGVEVVHSGHQEQIDHFLKGSITELEFLESINYRESWRFPWNQYRNFFLMAKEKGIQILALNSEGTLKQRDKKAAGLVNEFLTENEKAKILILFGEYHIIPTKLPKEVEKLFGQSIEQTIIHQNLDEVYWKLNSIDIEKENQVVSFHDNEFSIQSSPPWIKYESMIYWFEHLLEDPDFDIHEYLMETGMMAFNSSVHENFFYLSEKVSNTLGLEFSRFELEDYNLYDHQSLNFITEKIETITPKTTQKFLIELLKQGKSFKLPNSQNYYCSSYSLNRMSFLCGVHIFHTFLGEKHKFHSLLVSKSKAQEKFLYFSYQFMAGYFSSKIINPYRKCDLYQDFLTKFKSLYQGSSDYQIYKAALAILDFSAPSNEFSDTLTGLKLKEIYEVAKKVGYHLAELMYENFYSANHTNLKVIKAIFLNKDISVERFLNLRKSLLHKDYKNLKKRLF